MNEELVRKVKNDEDRIRTCALKEEQISNLSH